VANKAYSFDGVNDFIQTPIDNSNYSAGITISAWVNIVGANSINNPQFAISKEWDQVNGHFALLWNNNLIGGDLNNLASGGITIPQNIPFGNFKHICFTYNGSQLSLYSNGILLNSTPYSNLLNSVSSTIFFGKHQGFDALTYYFLNGKLDDIAIYNRALTQQEITNLYTSSAPPSISTSAAPSLINCGETATLTASSTSTAQPCIKSDLPATLQNGLVGYWPFCGNANDASGNNNNGTVNGATLTNDRFGNANSAYSFNGVSSKIQIPDANIIDFSNNYTLCAWYNTSSSTQLDQVILGKGGLTGGTGYQLLVNGNNTPKNLQFGYNNSVGLNGGASTPVNSSNLIGWHMLTGTYDGSFAKLFLDGVLMTTVNITFSLPNSTQPLLIGNETNSLVRFFNGKLDDIAIYNRALSASEIQQLYNLGNVTYSWSTGATTPSITVTPAQTSTYTCTATNASGSTTSSVTVNVADTLTWTGALDTDWHKPCNWSPQFVPKCCNNVSVPLTTNQPVVSGVAAAEDLTIYTTNGAQLTVNNGANLQIADCPTTITTTACPSLAVITTTAVSSINQTTAVSGGTISYQGASAITARGICWGTSPNPTIANSLTSNGTGIGTFTSNLTGLVAGTTYYVRAYATNGSGTSYGNQVSFVAVNPPPVFPAGSVFCAAGQTAIVDVTNPSTGKTWMDRNLGASQVATSSTDAAAYGDLYQWGRRSDGHQCRNSTTTTTLSSTDQPGNGNFIVAPNTPNDWRSPQNINLWQGLNGVNNPCPSGYRLPTETELDGERLSWSSNNSAGAFGSTLKWSNVGGRLTTGVLNAGGTTARYWSSTIISGASRALAFETTNAYLTGSFARAFGFAIRCIKN
jgi:uncharacterized protein (TIGR02145 family)